MFRNLKTPIFTLLFSLASIWWGVEIIIASGIGNFYHPNAAKANLGAQYAGSIALAILANWLIVMLFMYRRSAKTKFKWLCLGFCIFLSLVFTLGQLRQQNSNYKITYFIEDDAYQIPWEYNPINGSPNRGGTYFVIRVSYPDFAPQYKAKAYHKNALTISRHLKDSNYGRQAVTRNSLQDDCFELPKCDLSPNQEYQLLGGSYQFSDGKFVYGVNYQGNSVTFKSKEELSEFREKIIRLFNSFKVE